MFLSDEKENGRIIRILGAGRKTTDVKVNNSEENSYQG